MSIVATENNTRHPRDIVVDMGLLCVVLILSIVVVNPVGNFPLADDWAYGATVKHLLGTGEYRPQGEVLAPMITNILWGSLFCLPDGFSFTPLRVSTLVASLIGAIGTYILIFRVSGSRTFAILGALTLEANPIYLGESFTFNTDVLFVAILVWCVIAFARVLATDSRPLYLGGIALSVAATLSRQLAICVSLAFLCASLFRTRITIGNIARASAPALFSISAYFLFRSWLLYRGKTPALFEWHTRLIVNTLERPALSLEVMVNHGAICVTYLGLFMLPIAIPLVIYIFRKDRRWTSLLLVCGFLILLAIGVILTPSPPPPQQGLPYPVVAWAFPILQPIGDFLRPWGLGWPTTFDDEKPSEILTAFWATILAIGAISSGVIFARCSYFVLDLKQATRCREYFRSIAVTPLFLFLCVVFYMPPMLFSFMYDRYFIPMISVIAALLACIDVSSPVVPKVRESWLPLTSIIILTVVAVASIVSTRDFLMYNRVYWDALVNLMSHDHVRLVDIEGGWEFDSFYAYNPDQKRPFDPRHDTDLSPIIVGVHYDTYITSLTEKEGYDIIKEYDYQQWIPAQTRRVLVLRKRDIPAGERAQRMER